LPVGALAYWPSGNALCLFRGLTPASENDEPRAASPVTVNVFGRLHDVSVVSSKVSGTVCGFVSRMSRHHRLR